MIDWILQGYITMTAPLAVYLLGRGKRRLACIVGLASQAGFAGLFGPLCLRISIIP